jgi:hypothetical protein
MRRMNDLGRAATFVYKKCMRKDVEFFGNIDIIGNLYFVWHMGLKPSRI